jgi:hypothetical protein
VWHVLFADLFICLFEKNTFRFGQLLTQGHTPSHDSHFRGKTHIFNGSVAPARDLVARRCQLLGHVNPPNHRRAGPPAGEAAVLCLDCVTRHLHADDVAAFPAQPQTNQNRFALSGRPRL